MKNKQLNVLRVVLKLANLLANNDDTMIGAQALKNYHYSTAIDLVMHHLDDSIDIRWLEPTYDSYQKEIEEMLNEKN